VGEILEGFKKVAKREYNLCQSPAKNLKLGEKRGLGGVTTKKPTRGNRRWERESDEPVA